MKSRGTGKFEREDNAFRCRVWFSDGPVWSQELDFMVLMSPFQSTILYAFMVSLEIKCLRSRQQIIQARQKKNSHLLSQLSDIFCPYTVSIHLH